MSVDALHQEIATLRRVVANHPAVQTLRFVAPFIRDAIEAGTWKAGPGTESVQHEINAALAWAERFEATATSDP